MSGRILNKCARICWFPIAANGGFFIVMMILGVIAPFLLALTGQGYNLYLLFFATAQSAAWSYFWSAAVLAFGRTAVRTAVKSIILIIYSLLALVEVGAIVCTGVVISIDEINLMVESNVAETKGFFIQYFSWRIIPVIVVVGAFVAWAARCIPNFCRAFAARWPRLAVVTNGLLLLLLLLGGWRATCLLQIYGIKDYYQFLIWEAEPRFGRETLNFNNQIRQADLTDKFLCYAREHKLQNGEYALWEGNQRRALDSRCTAPSDREFNIVIIIGESFIRQHSSLYGYPLLTDPRMKAEADSGRVAVYTNMISTANFTTFSIRNLMNLNDLWKGERWSEGVYFPLLLRKAGRNVYHYDNQTTRANEDAGIARMFYNDFNFANTYNAVSDSCFRYDGEFINYLGRRYYLREEGENKLVIYHLMGQHFPASGRYPGEGVFGASDIKADAPWITADNRSEIARYDNATRYTDSVVGQILDRYKGSESIVIYFSDHGEDIWDLAPCEARNRPAPEDDDWLDRQFHIPFFVWTSDMFQRKYPRITEAIHRGATRPGSLDNLGQMILGIAGIDTEYYDSKLDITSDDYSVQERITSEGYRISDNNLTFP